MTAIDGINPINIINCYSQIIDPIINSKNMYYEISIQVSETSSTSDLLYKNDVFVVMGELLRGDKTPRNGYGCRIRNGVTINENYDIYTCKFNNNYGSTGLNSASIQYNSYTTSSFLCANCTIGVGWNYSTKTLFYHLNPLKHGNEYGLSITNVEFPTNTRIYVFGIDVQKEKMKTSPLQVFIDTKNFVYTDVANLYLNS